MGLCMMQLHSYFLFFELKCSVMLLVNTHDLAISTFHGPYSSYFMPLNALASPHPKTFRMLLSYATLSNMIGHLVMT